MALMGDRIEVQWCVDCGARFTAEEIANAYACPKCGSGGIPCDAAQDLRLEVNWHELRILGIWAENYARESARRNQDNAKMPRTVLAICRRLQRQQPSLPPLTLSEEIAALPKALADVGIVVGNVETTVPRPDLIVTHGPGAVGHTNG